MFYAGQTANSPDSAVTNQLCCRRESSHRWDVHTPLAVHGGNFMHKHRWWGSGWQGPPSLPWGPLHYCFLWTRVNLLARAERQESAARPQLTLRGEPDAK